MNEPPSPTSLPALLLIAAHLVPAADTALLGWVFSDVMVLYWAQCAIIGFYNLCKIVLLGRWFALLAGPFFLGHVGGFLVLLLEGPVLVLTAVIALKVFFDLRAHIRQPGGKKAESGTHSN